MSALKKYFDKSVNQSSPIQKDLARKVNYDEKGEEYITWEEVDYPSIIKEHGDVSFWSLDALLKAGINPNFPIRTGLNTRLEGVDVVNNAVAELDAILAEDNNNKE